MSGSHIDFTAEVDQLSTAFRDLTPAQAFALLGALAYRINCAAQPLADLERDTPLATALAGIGTQIDLLSAFAGLAINEQECDWNVHHVVDEIGKITDRVAAKGRTA